MSGANISEATVRELRDQAQKCVELCRRAGADAAEVLVRDGSELTVKVRLGEPELVQEAGSRALGLRVFKGGRRAVTYTSDLRDKPLARSSRRASRWRRCPSPTSSRWRPIRRSWPPTCPTSISTTSGSARSTRRGRSSSASSARPAARGADPRISNSDGATWSRVVGATAFATSGGFVGGYRGTYASFYVEPICDDASEATPKKRNGYWWTADRFLARLDDPEAVGPRGARRTVAQLGSRKIPTQECPVVFDPEVARSLVGTVFSVANGSSFWRKSTYLLGREGTLIASPLVTIVDRPHMPRAPGSRPFDGDGLPTRDNTLVRAGVLETVLCDTYAARKLGRKSTGSSGRGIGGNPGPTTSNLILEAGTTPRAELLRSTGRGLYVTSMMGFGFNPVTGDFSRGASGFWIENGELTFPVSEITVSCNFDQLLQRIDASATTSTCAARPRRRRCGSRT
jgi:PmbA protein